MKIECMENSLVRQIVANYFSEIVTLFIVYKIVYYFM